MQEYKNYWKNYANFNDRTSVRGYWMVFVFNVIINIVISILLTAGGYNYANLMAYSYYGMSAFTYGLSGFGMFMYVVQILWGLANIVPGLAIVIRRLHDAGRPWVYILFALIPCVGWILMIVMLTKPTIPSEFSNRPQV